jgi:hypothetical protein
MILEHHSRRCPRCHRVFSIGSISRGLDGKDVVIEYLIPCINCDITKQKEEPNEHSTRKQ